MPWYPLIRGWVAENSVLRVNVRLLHLARVPVYEHVIRVAIVACRQEVPVRNESAVVYQRRRIPRLRAFPFIMGSVLLHNHDFARAHPDIRDFKKMGLSATHNGGQTHLFKISEIGRA